MSDSDSLPLKQLRTPAAALISITIVLSLLDARATGLRDTDTIWFMLALIAVTATLLGVVSRSSCRTQGLSGTVFAVIATRLFVFEGVVGGAYRLVEVVAARWSLRRPAWMRLRMV